MHINDPVKFIADLELILGHPLMEYQRKFITQLLDDKITDIRISRHSNKIPIFEACKMLGKSIDYIIIDEVETANAS